MEPGLSVSKNTPVPPTTENQKLLTKGAVIDTAMINSRMVLPREILLIKMMSIGAYPINHPQKKIVQEPNQALSPRNNVIPKKFCRCDPIPPTKASMINMVGPI